MKLIFLFFFIFFFNKYANSNSIFESDFFEVDFISNNIENDKLDKINEIKIKSIYKIFRNILIEEDFYAIKKNLNQDTINSLIKNIVINDEKIINNYYYSKIKINYGKKQIINYLRNKKISYVEYLPNNLLTIVYENNYFDKNLFSQNNLHYNHLINNNNIFYKIPNLDINDRFILTYIDIEDRNYKKIDNFIKKYNSQESIIIIINKSAKKIEYNVVYYTNKNFINLINLTYDEYDFNIFNTIKNKILNQWKIENSIQNETINKINCELKYYNLLELKHIKNTLINVSIVKNLTLENISYKSNFYEIHFYGNNNILAKLLKKQNINILFNNEKCKIFLK